PALLSSKRISSGTCLLWGSSLRYVSFNRGGVKFPHEITGVRIPNPDSSIEASGGQFLSIGAEGDGVDPSGCLAGRGTPAGFDVIDGDLVGRTTHSDPAAIRRKSKREDYPLLRLELADQ